MGGIQLAFGMELLEKGDGGELAELAAGGAVHALLQFCVRADEFDEDDLAVAAGDEFDGAFDKARAHGCFGGEGEDQAGNLRAGGLIEDGEPDLFAQFDERWAAKFEYGE